MSTSAWVISTMMLASCVTIHSTTPAHCVTKDEWPNYAEVARQKYEIHKPVNGRPTENIEYAERVSMLEGRCLGINAIRGEGQE